MPVTDREKRRTEPAKVTLTPPHVPEANLTVPTRVSGGGSSLLKLLAVADASSTSPNPGFVDNTQPSHVALDKLWFLVLAS